MGCRSCGAGVFDPAPLSPQAVRATAEANLMPAGPVHEPTLINGVMMYPEGAPQPEAIDGFERTGLAVLESVMPPCQHRYEVMAVERDGVTTVKHTCLDSKSGHTNQYVTKSACDGCPLRRGG
jgi:hypothetical protein